MNGLLPTDEYTEVENRSYLNPNLQVDETATFIDNLRNTQQQNNVQIAGQTQPLGTNVPSSLGGLLGGEGYWTSRMQTAQTNDVVQNLRTAAQVAALNQALENEQAMWKKRYDEAYRNYQKRQDNRIKSSNGGNGGNDGTTDGEVVPQGEVDNSGNYSTIEIDPLTGRPGYYSVVDPYTGIVTDVDMQTGQNSQRGISYDTIRLNDMRNEKYEDANGNMTWGWTYTLPSGKKVGIKWPKQNIVRGSDGNYYKYENGTYSYLGR